MPLANIVEQARQALGRRAGQSPEVPPPPRIRLPEMDAAARLRSFVEAFEKLSGKTHLAATREDACAYIEQVIAGRRAVASNAPLLRECSVTALASVRSGFTDREALRTECAGAEIGITGADYALADTGTLVLFSTAEEARMVSLLPPLHIAVIRRERILTGLDELFDTVPLPSDRSSSMVFITGPSRTADIEQILVRGVHGPGEIHAVVL
jgi:L-lactate dehydrogenase complex protein LldG